MKKFLLIFLFPFLVNCTHNNTAQEEKALEFPSATAADTMPVMDSVHPLTDSTTQIDPEIDTKGIVVSDYWTWYPKYKLFNAKVFDSFSDTSGGKWELIIGCSKKDTANHWPTVFIVNQTQNKKHHLILPQFEEADEKFLEKNNGVDAELLGSTMKGLLGRTLYNGYPRYVFLEGNETGSNDFIYYYDFKIKRFRRVCMGTLIKIVNKENLYIQVFDEEATNSEGDEKGDIYFDKIVTPTGKVLWKGKPYYKKY